MYCEVTSLSQLHPGDVWFLAYFFFPWLFLSKLVDTRDAFNGESWLGMHDCTLSVARTIPHRGNTKHRDRGASRVPYTACSLKKYRFETWSDSLLFTTALYLFRWSAILFCSGAWRAHAQPRALPRKWKSAFENRTTINLFCNTQCK